MSEGSLDRSDPQGTVIVCPYLTAENFPSIRIQNLKLRDLNLELHHP